MSASINDNFTKVAVAGSETTLASPGKALAATSINITSASGWPTDTGVVFAIRQVDSSGNLVAGTYTEWIGTLSGTTISGLTGTPLYGSDQVYAAGSTTQVYIPLSSARENRLVAALLQQHNQDGSHSTLTATSLVTNILQPTLDSAFVFEDASGNAYIKVVKASGAVNYIKVGNAATGNGPTLLAAGSDTDVDFNINTQAAGQVKLNGNPVTSGAWKAWTPSYSNLTIGNGTVVAKYAQVGKTIKGKFIFTLGSGSAVGTGPSFTLPETPAAGLVFEQVMGLATFINAGIDVFLGVIVWNASGSIVSFRTIASSAGVSNIHTAGGQQLTALAPFTFGIGDSITCSFEYEAA